MSSILCQWQAPTPVPDTYNFYLGTAGAGSETLYRSGVVTTSLTIPSPVYGDTYYGYVTGVFGGVEGPPSNEAFVVAATPPPPTPSLQGFDILVQNEPVNLLTGS